MQFFICLDGNLEFYRIPGVLQRFGVCYFFVAMMQLLLPPMEKRERKVTLKLYSLLCVACAIDVEKETSLFLDINHTYLIFTVLPLSYIGTMVGSVPRCIRLMETVDLCTNDTRCLSCPDLWSGRAWMSQVRSKACL